MRPASRLPVLGLLLLLPTACRPTPPPAPLTGDAPAASAAVAGGGSGALPEGYPAPSSGPLPGGAAGVATGVGSAEPYPAAGSPAAGRSGRRAPFLFPYVAIAPTDSGRPGDGGSGGDIPEGGALPGDGAGAGSPDQGPEIDPPDVASSPSLAPPPVDGPISPEQRRAFLAQAEGYAAGLTGGLAGPEVWVTQLGDRGEGSLRAALEAPGPAWVRLAVDGAIRLKRPIQVKSDKTLDGRGRRVEVIGHGLLLDRVSNVVLSHLVLHDGKEDAVSLSGARMVWLHHLSLARFDDGLIDITNQSGEVTVSWCRLEDHEKGMLVGSKDWQSEDVSLRVTVHHSSFVGVRYRHPKLRYGTMHLYNLLIDGWTEAAIDVSHGGRLLVENSLLLPGTNKPGPVFGLPVDPRDPPGFARARGVDAGGLPLPDDPRVEDPPYPYRAEPLNAELVRRLREETGWRP